MSIEYVTSVLVDQYISAMRNCNLTIDARDRALLSDYTNQLRQCLGIILTNRDNGGYKITKEVSND